MLNWITDFFLKGFQVNYVLSGPADDESSKCATELGCTCICVMFPSSSVGVWRVHMSLPSTALPQGYFGIFFHKATRPLLVPAARRPTGKAKHMVLVEEYLKGDAVFWFQSALLGLLPQCSTGAECSAGAQWHSDSSANFLSLVFAHSGNWILSLVHKYYPYHQRYRHWCMSSVSLFWPNLSNIM